MFDLSIFRNRVRSTHACSLEFIENKRRKREREEFHSDSLDCRRWPLERRLSMSQLSFLLVLIIVTEITTSKANAILLMVAIAFYILMIFYWYIFLELSRPSLEKSKYIDTHVREQSGINRTTVNVTWSIQAWKKQPAFFKWVELLLLGD